MIRSHESAYIDHIKRLLEEAVEKDEIESVDTRAVAIMLGTVARIFSKRIIKRNWLHLLRNQQI